MHAFISILPSRARPGRSALTLAIGAGALLTAWIGAHARAPQTPPTKEGVAAVCRDCRAYAPFSAQ